MRSLTSSIFATITAIGMSTGSLVAAAQTPTAASFKRSHSEQVFRSGLAAYNVGNYADAMRLWSTVAGKGNVNAQTAIGYLYFAGLGVAQSVERARSWYAIAATQGEPNAQYHMGLIYLLGKGVKKDPAEAYMWCDLAMKSGYTSDAFHCREEASRNLSELEIQEAEQRGRGVINTAKF